MTFEKQNQLRDINETKFWTIDNKLANNQPSDDFRHQQENQKIMTKRIVNGESITFPWAAKVGHKDEKR